MTNLRAQRRCLYVCFSVSRLRRGFLTPSLSSPLFIYLSLSLSYVIAFAFNCLRQSSMMTNPLKICDSIIAVFRNPNNIRIAFESYLRVPNTLKKMLFAFYIIHNKAPIVALNTTKRMDNFKKSLVYSFNRMFVCETRL